MSLLMREIDRIARGLKWSNKDLAEALGVDPTMLVHIRARRNQFSVPLLGKIARAFPPPVIDEFIMYHLRVERAAHDDAKLAVPDDLRIATLDAFSRREIRAFVRHFPRMSVETGRGLYLTGSDTALLASGVEYIQSALEAQGIAVERLAANAAVTPSHRRAALAAPLLIIERIEYVSVSVADLLLYRSEIVKPMLVTSTVPALELDDTRLARVLTSMLRRVVVYPRDTDR
jgi:transcriptional regulator with XRE-family HTH domain